MNLTPDLIERTTAATDLLLALLAGAGVIHLSLSTPRTPGRVSWQWTLATFALAATLGAAAHGISWSPIARELLWHLVYIAVGLAVTQFLFASILQSAPQAKTHTRRLWLLTGAIIFCATIHLGAAAPRVFVSLQTLALGFGLIVHGKRAIRGERGAMAICVALLIAPAAALVQTLDELAWRGPVPLDRNGIAHLLLLIALVPLIHGVAASTRTSSEERRAL